MENYMVWSRDSLMGHVRNQVHVIYKEYVKYDKHSNW